jgi:hypothetical protein
VVTDRADYAPGTPVIITGGGWLPGESVALSLVEVPALDVHALQPVVADGAGNIVSTEFAPDVNDLGITFFLTATGSASQAQTSFTDADTTPPTVSSIVRAGSNPTNAASVSWTATFSEPVNGVDSGDFALVIGAGLSGPPSIGSVTPVGAAPAAQWTVTASTGTGSGTLGLSLNDNDSITDIAANKLGGTGTGVAGGGGVGNGSFIGQSYTIDRTPPTVTINQKAGQADPTNVSPINFTAVFSKPVKLATLGLSDILITGAAGGAVTAINNAGDDRTFFIAVSDMTSDGTVTASIPAGAITDLVGNANTASTSTDNAVTYEVRRRISIDDVTANEGNSGMTAFTFTVSLDAPSVLQDISVNYATAIGSAASGADCSVAGSDFKAQSGTVTIPKLSTSRTVTISVCSDTVYEADEVFFVNLSSPTSPASIADNQGQGTIVNDDAAPVFTIGNVSQIERNSGVSTFTFTVAKSGPTEMNAFVDYAYANGTTNRATGAGFCATGIDYIKASGSLVFAPSETSKPLNVTVCGDAVFELDETFFVNLSNAFNATFGVSQGIGTILNDDAAPTLAIRDVLGVETNSGTTTFNFSVTRSGATEVGSTVDFATAPGVTNPASGGAACGVGVDYVNASGTLAFSTSDTAKTLAVTVCGDAVFELNETFLVSLTNPTAASITAGQAVGTITNDDAPPKLAIDNVSAPETNAGATTFTFTVTKTGTTELPVSVDFATANGSLNAAATGPSCGAGVDYVSQNGTVTFGAGETSRPVTVSVCGDTVYEANETFVVNLTNPAGATLANSQGLGTITNDDAAPSFAINDAVVTEGSAGTVNATFTVTKTGETEVAASVDVATASGVLNPAVGGASCGAGIDYVSRSGSLNFDPAEGSKPFTVAVCGDAVYEADETFVVNLTNLAAATVGRSQGLGTITNDDAAPSFAIDDVVLTEGNAGTVNAVFTVTKTGATELAASTDFATAAAGVNPATGGASCGGGVDYLSQWGTLSFAPAETSKTIAVPICGDTTPERSERFVVALTKPTAATIGDDQGLGTIRDDDTFFAGPFTPYGTDHVFPIKGTFPVKWSYTSYGVVLDSSTSTPVMSIRGPLADCGDVNGPGSSVPVSYDGPGSTTMAYDPLTKTWQVNVKLSSPPFVGDACYIVQVADPVTEVTSAPFVFRTKK